MKWEELKRKFTFKGIYRDAHGNNTGFWVFEHPETHERILACKKGDEAFIMN